LPDDLDFLRAFLAEDAPDEGAPLAGGEGLGEGGGGDAGGLGALGGSTRGGADLVLTCVEPPLSDIML